jgi:hypothetical protein
MIFRRQGLLGGREIALPQLLGPRRGEVGDPVRLEPGPRPGD